MTDPLKVPPPSRPVLALAMVAVFLLGAGLAAFVVANPLELSFLPQRAAAPAAARAPGEPATLYQCPMHPEVIEDHPADCPICGMPLVAMASGGADAASSAPAEREVLYWYAPMDPTYVRDEPGLSPMGMELVPKYAEEAAPTDDGTTIRIDPVQVQNIGVTSTPARRADIARTARTVGILDFDAEAVSWVNVKYDGWIETVHVNYVGQQVRAGQPLFEIYSPALVTTQEEYLRALDYREALAAGAREQTRRQAESLLAAARERLTLWDIDDEQVAALEARRSVERRVVVRAPTDGIVAKVMDGALEGMHVKAGMNLYKIADLSTVWVHADVYESDLPWVREGQPASVSFRFDPERTVRGRVLFLYPEVSRETRTLKICVEIPNPGRRLRAGMFADVTIEGPPERDALVIPDAAVLRSGMRELVFVDMGEGRFASREVELGLSGEDGLVQVRAGLAEGEAVVTQAQFMLDSESRVQEAIAKFMERGTAGDGDHAHGE